MSASSCSWSAMAWATPASAWLSAAAGGPPTGRSLPAPPAGRSAASPGRMTSETCCSSSGPPPRSPRRASGVGPAVDDPVTDLLGVVAVEDVVERRRRPGDVDPAALLDVVGTAAAPVGSMTVGAADRGHHLGAALGRLLVELLDKAGLPVLFAEVVDGEVEGEELSTTAAAWTFSRRRLSSSSSVFPGATLRGTSSRPRFRMLTKRRGRRASPRRARPPADDDGGGQQTSSPVWRAPSPRGTSSATMPIQDGPWGTRPPDRWPGRSPRWCRS